MILRSIGLQLLPCRRPWLLSGSRGWAIDNPPSGSRPAREVGRTARPRLARARPSSRTTVRRSNEQVSLRGVSGRADQAVVVIEERDAEVEQDAIEIGLAFAYRLIEATLPILLVVPDAEGDSIGQRRMAAAWPGWASLKTAPP